MKNDTQQVDLTGIFNKEALLVFYSGSADAIAAAMRQMYCDAFLYGHHCGLQPDEGIDYNALSFEERYNINELHTYITRLCAIVGKYDTGIFDKGEVMVSAADAAAIMEGFEEMLVFTNVPEMLRNMDTLIGTTAILKLVSTGETPGRGALATFYQYTQIKEILTGFIAPDKA